MDARSPSGRHRWAKGLLIASAALSVWGSLVAITGGFRIHVAGVRLSAHGGARPLLAALLLAVLAWRLAYRVPLESWIQRRLPRLRYAPATIAALAAFGLLLAGISCGVRAAGASDPFGYVSQAALWAAGTLRIDQSFAASMPWPEASQTFVPLGYRAGPDHVMVPTYAPGLPLLMAAAGVLHPCGPYLVAPACGALLTLFTFQLGRRVFSAATGAAAALLVACSPVVLFMSLMPMADVPAAACWTGALALAAAGSTRPTAASGLLAGLAILIRPNLVHLAVFPWLLAIHPHRALRPVLVRTALFAAGSLPGALFIAGSNRLLYGSPLASGYGDLGSDFALAYAGTNLARYSSWWWESQGPLAFLFLAGPWLGWRTDRVILAACAGSVALSYVFYLPFEWWWYLRFLVPAVPIAFLFCAHVVEHVARGSATLRLAGLVTFTALAAVHGVAFERARNVPGLGVGEQRYVEPALHIAAETPADAVILAMQHSGSVRYYAGRLTLRWDGLDPAWLDRSIDIVSSRGIATYLLVESWEESVFRVRFRGQQTLHILEAGPVATARNGEIRLYRVRAPAPARPTDIPVMAGRPCLDVSPAFRVPAAVARLR